MSWCRWSSLDWRCDLYVYESERGVEVDVAVRRRIIDPESLPAPIDPAVDIDAWAQRADEVHEIVRRADMIPIGLPHDGEYRTFDTLDEAADWIDELDRMGYVVPEGMTDQMREDGQ